MTPPIVDSALPVPGTGIEHFEDLPGKWQAAILEAEQNRPTLRLVSGA